jgi:hypothetical protein
VDYCKALKFNEIPDYSKLHGIIQAVSTKEITNSEAMFDWILEAAV